MTEAKRVLICGSRGWTDATKIRALLALLPEGSVIIHGDSAGADRMAGSLAELEFGMTVEKYPANWREQGRAAGALRNMYMLTEGKPDVVVAFYLTPITPGTADMIMRARRAGLPVLGVSNL